jgi:hypothetical protein
VKVHLEPQGTRPSSGKSIEYNGCLAQAAKADSQFAKQQWLIFADEWLKLALVAEEQQREESEQPLAWM